MIFWILKIINDLRNMGQQLRQRDRGLSRSISYAQPGSGAEPFIKLAKEMDLGVDSVCSKDMAEIFDAMRHRTGQRLKTEVRLQFSFIVATSGLASSLFEGDRGGG